MNRLRIGHSKLNSTLHIMGKYPIGFCEHCQTPETVEHVIVNCRKYEREREDMIKNMESIGITGCGLKDILECSERKERECLFQRMRI